jgi:hypothetical protein
MIFKSTKLARAVVPWLLIDQLYKRSKEKTVNGNASMVTKTPPDKHLLTREALLISRATTSR